MSWKLIKLLEKVLRVSTKGLKAPNPRPRVLSTHRSVFAGHGWYVVHTKGILLFCICWVQRWQPQQELPKKVAHLKHNLLKYYRY